MKTRKSIEDKYGKEPGDLIIKYLAVIAARAKQVSVLKEKLALYAKAGGKGRKRHKNDSKTFGGVTGLSFPEQAKSISTMTLNLEAAVKAHIRKARKELGPKGEKRDPIVTQDKCIAQIGRMLARLKRKYALTLVVAALLATGQHGFAQNGTGPGSVDLPFTGYTNVVGPVRHLLPRPGGGYFIVDDGNQLFALTASIQRDAAFQSSAVAPGNPRPFSPLADGRLYVARGGGVPSTLQRLLPNGTVDTTFVPNFVLNGPSGLVVEQPDGKVLASVSEAVFNGFTKTGITRFNNDGTLDTSFHYAGTGPSGAVGLIQVLPDNKILIAGGTSVNGITRNGLSRLNADGTLDSSYTVSFNSGGSLSSYPSFYKAPGGKLVLMGSFTAVGGVNTTNLARLNQDGTVDAGFVCAGIQSPIPSLAVLAHIVQADGKVIIGGGFTNVGGFSRNGVARLNADGSLDGSFDPGTGIEGSSMFVSLATYTLAQQPDSKVLIGGPFYRINGVFHSYLARLNGDGGPVVSQSTNAGNITLSVATSGTGLTYQWQVNGTNLPGATGATFTVTNFAAANAGRYSVIVSNSAAVGVLVSQPAILRSFGDLRMFAGMSIAGESGDRYRIEAAEIIPGVTNWVAVTTFTHPGGTFLYTDPNSPGRAQRYYRAVLEP